MYHIYSLFGSPFLVFKPFFVVLIIQPYLSVCYSVTKKNWLPNSMQKKSREKLKPTNTILNNPFPTSHKPGHASSNAPNLQISHRGAFFCAPDSNMSSPSRSPVRVCGLEQVMNSGCSGQNSVDGDLAGHLFWQYCRCSPECSPIPTPRMTSPVSSSRIHSGSVTPLHPRSGKAIELLAQGPDGNHQGHRLPLPPINISKAYPSYSTETNPVPRSPSSVKYPTSHGPRWKKGKLLGRGTYGQVYLGFNRSATIMKYKLIHYTSWS